MGREGATLAAPGQKNQHCRRTNCPAGPTVISHHAPPFCPHSTPCQTGPSYHADVGPWTTTVIAAGEVVEVGEDPAVLRRRQFKHTAVAVSSITRGGAVEIALSIHRQTGCAQVPFQIPPLRPYSVLNSNRRRRATPRKPCLRHGTIVGRQAVQISRAVRNQPVEGIQPVPPPGPN